MVDVQLGEYLSYLRCRVIGFSDHVHFPVMEVLKNSVFAMVERWGSASVEDADPIILSVSSNDTHCGVPVFAC